MTVSMSCAETTETLNRTGQLRAKRFMPGVVCVLKQDVQRVWSRAVLTDTARCFPAASRRFELDVGVTDLEYEGGCCRRCGRAVSAMTIKALLVAVTADGRPCGADWVAQKTSASSSTSERMKTPWTVPTLRNGVSENGVVFLIGRGTLWRTMAGR